MTALLGEATAYGLDDDWEAVLYGQGGRRKMPALSAGRAAALLLQVAAEHPGYIHPRHEYLHHGRPGCLVAHVLHRAGASLAALDAADVANEDGLPLPAARLPDTRYFSRLTRPAAEVLSVAQILQDCGHPWSYAARMAVRKAVA